MLAAFRADLAPLAESFVRSLARRRIGDDPRAHEAWLLAIATVPALAAGVLLEERIESSLRSPLVVATMLVTFGALLLAVERMGAKRDSAKISLGLALLIGAAQAVARVPGVSRSGATITMGLFGG